MAATPNKNVFLEGAKAQVGGRAKEAQQRGISSGSKVAQRVLSGTPVWATSAQDNCRVQAPELQARVAARNPSGTPKHEPRGAGLNVLTPSVYRYAVSEIAKSRMSRAERILASRRELELQTRLGNRENG